MCQSLTGSGFWFLNAQIRCMIHVWQKISKASIICRSKFLQFGWGLLNGKTRLLAGKPPVKLQIALMRKYTKTNQQKVETIVSPKVKAIFIKPIVLLQYHCKFRVIHYEDEIYHRGTILGGCFFARYRICFRWFQCVRNNVRCIRYKRSRRHKSTSIKWRCIIWRGYQN